MCLVLMVMHVVFGKVMMIRLLNTMVVCNAYKYTDNYIEN